METASTAAVQLTSNLLGNSGRALNPSSCVLDFEKVVLAFLEPTGIRGGSLVSSLLSVLVVCKFFNEIFTDFLKVGCYRYLLLNRGFAFTGLNPHFLWGPLVGPLQQKTKLELIYNCRLIPLYVSALIKFQNCFLV